MDAILYLKQEHKKIRQLLKTISKISDVKKRKTQFNTFRKELLAHEKTEEDVWYPALRGNPELRDIIKHLVSEEKSAAQALKKFKDVTFEFMWTLRFYKLMHDVDHHAKEEEQELFPKARKVLSKTELNDLGTKMRKYKMSLKDMIK